MARNLAMKQFVYKYASSDDITKLPGNITYNPFEHDLCDILGSAIVSLGIQAPQGTKMYINGELAIVGPTGVFELDNVIEITSFQLGKNDYLRKVIIDVLYDKESENNL